MDTTFQQRQALLLAGLALILSFSVLFLAWSFRPRSPTLVSMPQLPVGKKSQGELRFQPESLTLKPGESARVSIVLDTHEIPIEAFDLSIPFDPRIISVTNISTVDSPFKEYPRLTIGDEAVFISGNTVGLDTPSLSVNNAIATFSMTGNAEHTTTKINFDTSYSRAFTDGRNIISRFGSLEIRIP